MDTVRSPDIAAVVRNNIVVVKEITVDTTGIESAYMEGMSYNTARIMVKTRNGNQKGKKKPESTLLPPPISEQTNKMEKRAHTMPHFKKVGCEVPVPSNILRRVFRDLYGDKFIKCFYLDSIDASACFMKADKRQKRPSLVNFAKLHL